MLLSVSIIIPVYNVQDYIQRCLESVIAQTYTGKIECIIVDDHGIDNSIKIAEEFISKNSSSVEFKIIHHKNNRGLAAARNSGVRNASGDFVMHLDSDDWLEPDALSILVKKQNETDADIVSGNAVAHYNDSSRILIEPEYGNNIDMVRNTIKLTLDHVIWRRLIRRSLYVDNNIEAIEGVNIGEDHHTLPRLAFYAKKIAKADAVVYHYNCMNPSSYMQSTKSKFCLSRYKNDSRSITILKDFFSDKNGELVAELDWIDRKYKDANLLRTIALKDKESYNLLCIEQSRTPHYYSSRIKYLIRMRFSSFLHRILKF